MSKSGHFRQPATVVETNPDVTGSINNSSGGVVTHRRALPPFLALVGGSRKSPRVELTGRRPILGRRAHLHRAASRGGQPRRNCVVFFLTQSKAPAAEKRTRAATRLPLYLFKCTSDKSSIQSGQGLPRLIALATTGLSTLVYSHLPTPRRHCGSGCRLPAACCLHPQLPPAHLGAGQPFPVQGCSQGGDLEPGAPREGARGMGL